MRKYTGTAFAAALVLGLAGCGGGGGSGGGGGGVPLLPTATNPTPTPAPAPPPAAAAAELKLTVEIGGSAVSPDSSGNYVVVPGQLVVVQSSDTAAWLGSAQSTGITRTDVDAAATQWVSRFANSSRTAAGSYKLVADASENRSKELNFTVKTGNYSNGEYMVFAGNGSRQKLSIDFDKASFSLTDAAGDTTSGTITPLGSPDGPDWLTQSSRMTVNSLYAKGDSIVGSLPFAKPYSAPGSYAESAFVATRALLTTQSKLDGTYDRARIEVSASGGESAIAQIQISGGGTVMKQCIDQVIYRIELCPAAKVVTSNVEADTEAGMWRLKDPADGTLLGRFAIANVEGDKIYLSAGTSPPNGNQVFAIGVPAAVDYVDFYSRGWSTNGTTELTMVSTAGYQTTIPTSIPMATLTLSSLAASSPLGIRSAVSGADYYFAMRSKRLELLIGARNPSTTAGYLHVGVIQ